MTTLTAIWAALLAAVMLVWGSRHIDLNRARRGDKPLSSRSFSAPPEPPPRVSLLVAAKDERENIEACVGSLLEQDYPNLEVIAINDRSTDGTGEILNRLKGANHNRLQVLNIEHLCEGWFGKNNAMREGIEHATGEWFCFTDADCTYISNNTISVAMRFAIENKIDLLSVLPVLETRSFWERVLQPVCAAIMVLWFKPQKVNNPTSSAAYANGAFMLMTRGLYNHIGGHERVRTEVNEDMHLARHTKQAGRRLYVVQNDDLYRTRMYSSFRECWRGWSRIFYGCFGTFRRLAVSTIVLTLASLLPWASLLAGGAGMLWAGGRVWALITVLSALALLAQQSVMMRFYRLNRSDPSFVALYPLGAALACGMLLNAMLKLGGRTTTTWRGTTYRGSRLATPAGEHRAE